MIGCLERGAGPPLIFLHGWTMDGSIFAGQFDRLADRFHCFAPDLPGHGVARDLTADLDSAAASLRDLIEVRDLSDVALVGWSMGAAVAWRYIASEGTGRLAGLVTVDMSPKIVNEAGWKLGLKGQTREAIDRNTARFAEDWAGSAGALATGMFANAEGAPGFGFDAAVAKIAANDPAAMSSMWASLVAMDERATIPRIDVPYLVTCGAGSRVYPAATAEWLARAAPRARLHAFAASGHSPHLEEPEVFAEVIGEFVASIHQRHHATVSP